MRKIRVGKWLDCGCCGMAFQTWKGYEDQDQDDGYGICKECQGIIEEHNRAELQKLIDCLRGGLSGERLEKFNSYDWDTQAGLAMQALEDGIITLTFKPRK